MIWRTIRLIAEREIRARLASKAYVRSTLFLSVALALLALLPSVLGGDDQDTASRAEPLTIAVVNGLTPTAREAIAASLPLATYELDFVDYDDVVGAEDAVAADEADAIVRDGEQVIVGDADVFGEAPGWSRSLAEALRVATLVERGGGDGALAAELTSVPPVPVEVLASDGETPSGARFLIANFGAMFLYGTLLMYGMWIVNGVIEEKSNRVVEMLLATVKPVHLLAGKVLGMGLLGIGQVLVVFAPAAIIGVTQVDLLADAGLGSTVAWIALWWVLGYMLYSVLLAGAGSLVSRPEEAQVVATPINLLLIVTYLLTVVGVNTPDGTLMQVASLVPFSAPIAMLMRQVIGHPAAWEVALSIGLTVAGIVGATFVGARLYEGAILRVGSRVGWRQAWRRAT